MPLGQQTADADRVASVLSVTREITTKNISRAVMPSELKHGCVSLSTEELLAQMAAESTVRHEPVLTDSSLIEYTKVHSVVRPKSAGEVSKVVIAAKEAGYKVCVGGQLYSQGGHTLAAGAILLDMSLLNEMEMVRPAGDMVGPPYNFDPDPKGSAGLVRIGSGALWSDLISYANEFGKAPIAMQSYSNFSVGGSASINAHGRGEGHVADAVVCFRLVDANGQIRTVGREGPNAELFGLALGGYGLFGPIIDFVLRMQDNYTYIANSEVVDVKDYPRRFEQDLGSPEVRTFIHVNTNNYSQLMVVKFRRATGEHDVDEHLVNRGRSGEAPTGSSVFTHIITLRSMIAQKNWAEFTVCKREIFQRWGDGARVTTNEMNNLYADAILPRRSSWFTFNLFESFVPQERFHDFVNGLEAVMQQQHREMFNTNIGVRAVSADTLTMLSYSPKQSFAFVFYFKTPKELDAKLQRFTQVLIEHTLSCGGTFYLPYRFHYTREQLLRAYPRMEQFLALKRQYDPDELFVSHFYRNLRSVVVEKSITPIPPNTARAEQEGATSFRRCIHSGWFGRFLGHSFGACFSATILPCLICRVKCVGDREKKPSVPCSACLQRIAKDA